MAAPYASERPRTAPVLEARALTLGRPGSRAPILERVDLALAPGECVLLEGATGSGKSTLLRALAGLRGIEQRSGELIRRDTAALLLQRVETQLLCTTVGEEVALGPRTRSLPTRTVEARTREALGRVGLAGFEGREVDTLSAGQKQRVVLAALLALEPNVLLLDEPASALDPGARRALAAVLTELKRRGASLLVADHASAELRAITDRCVGLHRRRLRERASDSQHPAEHSVSARRAGRPIEAIHPDSLLDTLRPGGRLLLTGPNGAGKSTWLRTLAQSADSRSAGRRGSGPSRSQTWGGVALAIQEPRRSLFARTVADEIGFGLERRRLSASRRRSRVEELLGRFELAGLADRSPLRPSFGQQHRLAIAAALAVRPDWLLLDEPFAGIDPLGRDALLALVDEEQERSGGVVVVTSHDRQPLASWCDWVCELPAERAR